MGSRQQGYATVKQAAGSLLISGFDEYANNRSTLKFSCGSCSNMFVTTAFLYLTSPESRLCAKCKHNVNQHASRDSLISAFTSVHGNYYSYTKIPADVDPTDQITITCPKHGDFCQTVETHNAGIGCSICKIDNVTNVTRSDRVNFIATAVMAHDFRYNYECVNYVDDSTAVELQCPKHGQFFLLPNTHLSGTGCPRCVSSDRIAELVSVLKETHISYTTEKIFPECRGYGGRMLRFDIFVPDRNLCIEHDGPHHYQPVKFAGMTDEQADIAFMIQQHNDQKKDEYCQTHNIGLLRIPHTVHHASAFLRRYLVDDYPADRMLYTYRDMQTDISKIVAYIKSFGYQRFAVYGIARGGIMFSIPVSYHFDGVCEYGVVTFQRYDGDSRSVVFDTLHKTVDVPIFIIDDLISSGITMSKAISAMRTQFPNVPVHPIVIFGEENKDDIFFIHSHPKQWVVFPYEI